jgi:hypothetical protein
MNASCSACALCSHVPADPFPPGEFLKSVSFKLKAERFPAEAYCSRFAFSSYVCPLRTAVYSLYDIDRQPSQHTHDKCRHFCTFMVIRFLSVSIARKSWREVALFKFDLIEAWFLRNYVIRTDDIPWL